MKNIKKHWIRCYDIFKGGLGGFGWDPILQNWTAEADVWKQLIELVSAASRWRQDEHFLFCRCFSCLPRSTLLRDRIGCGRDTLGCDEEIANRDASATSHRKPCMFFCQKCCAKCLCVPPGTCGNKQTCPCYNRRKTQ